MFPDLVASIINPVLILAILFLYSRESERFLEMLYGVGLGLLALAGLSLMGRLDSAWLLGLQEMSVLGFWLAARSPDTLRPSAASDEEGTGSRLDKLRLFAFSLLGIVLGLSPVFLPSVSLLTGARSPAIGASASIIAGLFLLVWLAFTLRGHFFRLPLVLLALAAVNLAQISARLIEVISSFVHDYYHLYSVVLLVPDHPYTRMWWYLAVDAILSPIFGATLITLLLIGPVIGVVKREVALYRQGHRPHGPQERREKADRRADLRRLGAFAVAIILTLGTMAFADLPRDTLESGSPTRAMIENDHILVAETNAFTRIEEGWINKYYVELRGQKITFTVLKTGGVYRAALDACSICGDEQGYSQTKNGVLICNLCSAIIPRESFGQAGGCNPIPLSVEQQPGGLTIDLDELEEQFKHVTRSNE